MERTDDHIDLDEPAGSDARRGLRLFGRVFKLQDALVLGLAVSLFLHALLALIGAILLISRPVPSLGNEEGEVEMAVMTVAELEELMPSQSASDEELFDEPADIEPFEYAELAPSLETSALTAFDQSRMDSMLAPFSDSAGAAKDSALSGLGGGGGGAKFFGVEARGSRFAYIVDTSFSMQGDRIEALKRALLASVEGLQEHVHFSIVLYSDGMLALTGGAWLSATDRYKVESRTAILGISASGTTNPIPALEFVLQMKPRPDAIYFMTDGQFSRSVEDRLRALVLQMNRGRDQRVAIHAISFLARESEPILRWIAQTTGGTYTHIEAVPK